LKCAGNNVKYQVVRIPAKICRDQRRCGDMIYYSPRRAMTSRAVLRCTAEARRRRRRPGICGVTLRIPGSNGAKPIKRTLLFPD